MSIDGLAGWEAVRRIRLQINTNGGDAYAGLSEIRADGTALAANVIPGDADASGDFDFNDAPATLGYIFLGSPADIAGCSDAGSTAAILDWNGDGQGDMSDAVASLRSEFIGGPGHSGGDTCAYFFSCDRSCP